MAGVLRRPDAQRRTKPERPEPRHAAEKSAAKRSRRPAQGATRTTVAAKQNARPSSAWLNRLLILLGAALVLAVATKAFITVQSLPVQRISVTGELEHTQAQAVQDMVQPGLADKAIWLNLGYGRKTIGRVGEGVGVDTYPLRTSNGFWVACLPYIGK